MTNDDRWLPKVADPLPPPEDRHLPARREASRVPSIDQAVDTLSRVAANIPEGSGFVRASFYSLLGRLRLRPYNRLAEPYGELARKLSNMSEQALAVLCVIKTQGEVEATKAEAELRIKECQHKMIRLEAETRAIVAAFEMQERLAKSLKD